jgi:hypothetical protein
MQRADSETEKSHFLVREWSAAADAVCRAAAAEKEDFCGNGIPFLAQISWHLTVALLAPRVQADILNLRAFLPSLFRFANERFLYTTCVTAAMAIAYRHEDQAGYNSCRKSLTAAPMHWPA